jgi:Flp pilus assembly protein TadD
MEQRDSKALNKLAASARSGDLPVQTVTLLASERDLGIECAQSLLRQAQDAHPDNFLINSQLAMWLDFASPSGQNLDETIRFYSAALALRPQEGATHFFLADALHRRGKLDEAISRYRKAIALEPDFAQPYSGLIVALRSLGRRDEADVEIRTALAARPNNATLYNSIAWILATCADSGLRDQHLAVEMAQKAVESAPKRGANWNTLGAAHYRAGNWQGAIAAFEKSMNLREGGDSFDWFFLAMAYWQLEERDKARHWYSQAAQWMKKNRPNDEELRRFRAEASALLGLPEPAAPAGKEVAHPAKR